MLGHMESSCDKLFDMVHDDGVRSWGPEIRAGVRRGARWLTEEGQPWQPPNHVLNVGFIFVGCYCIN